MYKVVLTKQAEKDAKRIERAGLKPQAAGLLATLRTNPFQSPPEYEKLHGFKDTYSRRVNRQHRLVYQILPPAGEDAQYTGVVKVLRLWTHYE